MRRFMLYSLLALAAAAAIAAYTGSRRRHSDGVAYMRADILITEAQQLSADGLPREAREKVEEALRIAPNHPRALREEALHLLAWDKPDEALALLRRATQTRDPRGAREIAALYAQLEQTDQAVRWLRRAIDVYPHDGLAHITLAAILVHRGESEEGLEVARRGVELAPRITEAHLNLGMALWQSGDRAAAVSAFDEALRLQPGDPRAALCREAVVAELAAEDAGEAPPVPHQMGPARPAPSPPP